MVNNVSLDDIISEIKVVIKNLENKGISSEEIEQYILSKKIKELAEKDNVCSFIYLELLSKLFMKIYNLSINLEIPGGKTKFTLRKLDKNYLEFIIKNSECKANFLTDIEKYKKQKGIFICPSGSVIVIKGIRTVLYKLLAKIPKKPQYTFCEDCYAKDLFISGRFTYIIPLNVDKIIEKIILQMEKRYGEEIKELYNIINKLNVTDLQKSKLNLKTILHDFPNEIYR